MRAALGSAQAYPGAELAGHARAGHLNPVVTGRRAGP